MRKSLIIMFFISLIFATHQPLAIAQSGADPAGKAAAQEASEINKLIQEGLYDKALTLIAEEEKAALGGRVPSELVKEAEALSKAKKYSDAVKVFGAASDIYEEIARLTGLSRSISIKRLEGLKASMEEKKRLKDREGRRNLKPEYLKILKERRELDKEKRRAELQVYSIAKKLEAAQRWEQVKLEKEKYELKKAKKAERIKVEKEMIVLAENKLKEERAAKREEGKLKPRAAREVKKTRLVKKEKRTKIKEKPVKVAKRKKSERQRAIEEARRQAQEKLTKERQAKAEERRIRTKDKKISMRGRLDRIEEAMFQKRQAREAKKREGLKKDAIKKATRCKKHLDIYSMRKDLDPRRLDKSKKLISRGDTYYEKEMYKEAGKLYNRAYLILRNKLY